MDRQTVKQLWNYAMCVSHNFWGFHHNQNSFLLGPIQPSSPTTKELHVRVRIPFYMAMLFKESNTYFRKRMLQTEEDRQFKSKKHLKIWRLNLFMELLTWTFETITIHFGVCQLRID